VFGRLLRTISLVACAIVLLSWAAFAIDEVRDASNRSTEQVQGREAARDPAPSEEQEMDRERANSPVREALDDANDVVVLPFAELVPKSDSNWLRRTVPMFLALLLYGIALGYLARFMATR